MHHLEIAIIGAGLSGVTAGGILSKNGHRVRIFEKSRGFGGRMATRRYKDYEFDHGAQFFTVRNPHFEEVVQDCVLAGAAKTWGGRIVTLDTQGNVTESSEKIRYVGTPYMSSLVRHLGEALPIEFGSQTQSLRKDVNGWKMGAANTEISGRFDVVILAIPPAQASVILGPEYVRFPQLSEIQMLPCWAVMVAFDQRLELSYDAAFVNESKLSWISRNSSKPQRDRHESWVLHGSPEWSLVHIEESPEEIKQQLLKEFLQVTGHSYLDAHWIKAHRWRYAQADRPLQTGFLWNSELGIGICGDWCHGSRVEGAFLSGKAIAEQILFNSSNL
jgi:predicted NAD/FAD-dependent oxidoreductase